MQPADKQAEQMLKSLAHVSTFQSLFTPGRLQTWKIMQLGICYNLESEHIVFSSVCFVLQTLCQSQATPFIHFP